MNEEFPKNKIAPRETVRYGKASPFSDDEVTKSISAVQNKYAETIVKQLLTAIAENIQEFRKQDPSLSFTEARTYALHRNLDQYTDVSWGPYVSALGVLFGKRAHVRKPFKNLAELIEDSKHVIEERGGDPED